jgi:hypothetical protein
VSARPAGSARSIVGTLQAGTTVCGWTEFETRRASFTEPVRQFVADISRGYPYLLDADRSPVETVGDQLVTVMAECCQMRCPTWRRPATLRGWTGGLISASTPISICGSERAYDDYGAQVGAPYGSVLLSHDSAAELSPLPSSSIVRCL